MDNSGVTTNNNYAKDCFLLLLLTAFIYLPFLGVPVWDGNEPLRVIIAKEMLKTGNWIIPMLHGRPYFTKPPMMNWLIAGSGSLFGVVNEWTSRIPSVCMVFATSLSIYFLTRKWLSREGRLFAAIAALCMIGLIKKGRTAEIDSLFIFFIVIILLVWLNGYIRGWKPALLWSIALLLVGLGFLTKGPQVIAYFYLTVFAYLFYRKNLSFFFSKSHLFGLLFFVLILVIYMAFILQYVTLEKYMQMWVSQITDRAESKTSFSFFGHLVYYPIEGILSFMPWMLLTIPILYSKDIRIYAKDFLGSELFVFSLVLIMINFPLYWLLPNARFRYFLPAGPFVAIGLAFLFEMYLKRAKENPAIERFFKGILSLHRIPLRLALTTGLLFITYSYIDTQFDTAKENNPRNIAKRINSVLPGDTVKVYEMGYRRFLGITCYVNKDIIQADEFPDLKALGGKKNGVYFLFDTKYVESKDSRKKAFGEIAWDKIYSEFFEDSRGNIVLGYLKNM